MKRSQKLLSSILRLVGGLILLYWVILAALIFMSAEYPAVLEHFLTCIIEHRIVSDSESAYKVIEVSIVSKNPNVTQWVLVIVSLIIGVGGTFFPNRMSRFILRDQEL